MSYKKRNSCMTVKSSFTSPREKAPRQCLRLDLRIRRLCVVHVGGQYCVAGCVVLTLQENGFFGVGRCDLCFWALALRACIRRVSQWIQVWRYQLALSDPRRLHFGVNDETCLPEVVALLPEIVIKTHGCQLYQVEQPWCTLAPGACHNGGRV